jgi:hypothetical protein
MEPSLRMSEVYRIEHRHRDGSWAPMEPMHHGEAEHDAERSWLRRAIFRCEHCQQQVTVTIEPIDAEPPTP